MSYYTYGEEQAEYPICVLVSSIRAGEIKREYLDDQIDPGAVIVMSTRQTEGKKKTPVKDIKDYIANELVPSWEGLKTEYVICADGDYFKALTDAPRATTKIGYVMDCVYGPWKVIYVPDYRTVFYDPATVKTKITQSINAMKAHREGLYREPGEGVIKFQEYPKSYEAIATWLQKLMDTDLPLTVDIEAFSLKPHSCGIGSISFAWNKHEGIAFLVDYVPTGNDTAPFGVQTRNEPVRALLRQFFRTSLEKKIYHNISFDVSAMIYQLFMSDVTDNEGLLDGMDIMLKDWECTKIISYLATNSCSGNHLGLKDQSQEFAGDYAEAEIKDITKIPPAHLLQYNLIDALATWHTYEKNHPIMVKDDQEEIYTTLFKPAVQDIIQMQLTGMPLNMERVLEVSDILEADAAKARTALEEHPVIKEFEYHLNMEWVRKKNESYKVKRVTLDDATEKFNPNSGPQLQALLFEHLKLPVIGTTKSKQPSTDKDTLKALKAHTDDKSIKSLLDTLLDLGAVDKILTSFLPAMRNAIKGADGWHYLTGNFNLGGTVSGRLSSSDPNLQTIPANSRYAKLIKSCFQAPPGYIFTGLDFASLEDRISALTTKDPNKLKVYTDGYDGHSLRAFSYFGDQMPDMVNTVEGINAMSEKGHKYAQFRQDSKTPTFLLTYGGTWIGIVQQCGFSEEKAKKIEANYHILYKVSDEWVAKRLDEASKTGYVVAAFGLRVRTPLLKQVIRGNRRTPFEAEAEGRTAGNALGQSWCLLNNRACSEFMSKVRSSKHRHAIRPIAHIHDAQYYMIKDDLEVLSYTNKHLVKAVQWQDHPDIWHDQVKLGGELSVFWPSWEKEITIPNGIEGEAIVEVINKALEPKT